MTRTSEELPLIHHPKYKIGLSWMQRFHPFDLAKSQRVRDALVKKGLVGEKQFTQPARISNETLLSGHTPAYLASLNDKKLLSRIFQIESLRNLPMWLIERLVIEPMRYHAGGTVLAGDLANQHGWAINLGGGMHHASSERGEGFCIFADISISIKELRQTSPAIRKVMIIDLDAHQGNGHERDFTGDPDVYTIDLYTHAEDFYPNDTEAMKKIDYDVKLRPYTPETDYFKNLKTAFNAAARRFKPDIIYYVAGTDILEGDKLGCQSVSREGIIRRDEMVFEFAQTLGAPIVMVFGGGYQMNNAPIIADSIENLDKKFGLFKAAGPASKQATGR